MTKFKVLAVIIKNRPSDFYAIKAELMKNFPEMSWEKITSLIALFGKEGYLNNLYGDDELQSILVQPDALVRICTEKEIAKSEQVKTIIDRILRLL